MALLDLWEVAERQALVDPFHHLHLRILSGALKVPRWEASPLRTPSSLPLTINPCHRVGALLLNSLRCKTLVPHHRYHLCPWALNAHDPLAVRAALRLLRGVANDAVVVVTRCLLSVPTPVMLTILLCIMIDRHLLTSPSSSSRKVQQGMQ